MEICTIPDRFGQIPEEYQRNRKNPREPEGIHKNSKGCAEIYNDIKQFVECEKIRENTLEFEIIRKNI